MLFKRVEVVVGEVASPGEGDEEYCGVVVYEHLPEVLPLHVKELAAHVHVCEFSLQITRLLPYKNYSLTQ